MVMDMQSSRIVHNFRSSVGIKFQLYNSLFTSLPFHRIERTGILLSLLLNNCEEGYKKQQSPVEILEDFFQRYTTMSNEREQTDLLFRFVQYAERQVVLFDALEDAAFREINDVNGVGTLKHLESEVLQRNELELLNQKLNDFSVRLVLTAHPTQFYPGPVLGIINDLSRALNENNANLINSYLQQLGKTPFFKKQKPTPYDEAVSLVWYLENVFYHAAGRAMAFLRDHFRLDIRDSHPIIAMGFWPGGDRDGNPNVTTDITLKVADALRSAVIKCYYLDVRRLKRRLTFKGIDVIINDLESKLYNNLFIPGQRTDLCKDDMLDALYRIRDIIIHQHNGLFLHLLDNLIGKVHTFGLHFASLDIRQDSSVHHEVFAAIASREQVLPSGYETLPEKEKMDALTGISVQANADLYEGVVRDSLESVKAVRAIQQYNGSAGCHRYIISQCSSAVDVLEVYGLFLLGGWKPQELDIDIVPLFETVDDLRAASQIMKTLYENEAYRRHLGMRGNVQTIMVGFSDGTKDGGYLMANWGIYKAKEELTALSRTYQIDVIFFDGRGGPPARGGGKTHKFYASMGKNISNKEIQLTIQGQTVSSSFGTVDSAQFNIEQLLNAGIQNDLFDQRQTTLEPEEDRLLQDLANVSFESYKLLKNDPMFLEYLAHVSPLKFYGETNIGSRPTKRNASSRMSLKDLRAIPFVGSWSQLKQNVPGYYGVGTALQALEKQGRMPELKSLYRSSLFFKTLIDNCEMAMKKCFFPLTAYLASDPRYGSLWNRIYQEYQLTEQYLLILTGKTELMADYPVESMSIQMRERIVLPIITIQQYAIARIREAEEKGVTHPLKEAYERLVVRCSFGIINAGRNSA
jgi:phosphoenolpyruvate carboxylase